MLRHTNVWTLTFKPLFSLVSEEAITFSVAAVAFFISWISFVVDFKLSVSCLFPAVSLVMSYFRSSRADLRLSELSSLFLMTSRSSSVASSS